MPAKSKFTAAVRERLLEVKAMGGPDTLACAHAGIDNETLRRWLAKGRAADEGMFAEFAKEYEEAKAAPQVRALLLFQKKLPDSDALLMKYIERQINGYEPPERTVVPVVAPTVMRLTLAGSDRPMPAWLDGETIDGPETPVLSDRPRDPAADPDPST